MRFRPDELSLVLAWTPRVNGQVVPAPGFYLRGSYANEGEAMGVVPGTWHSGYGGNGSLVSGQFLVDLTSLLYEHGLLEAPFHKGGGATLGRELADFQKTRQDAAVKAKQAELERLKAQVAEIEAALAR